MAVVFEVDVLWVVTSCKCRGRTGVCLVTSTSLWCILIRPLPSLIMRKMQVDHCPLCVTPNLSILTLATYRLYFYWGLKLTSHLN